MATSIKRSKGSQSSTQIGTFSFWIKRSTIGNSTFYSNTVEDDNNRGYFEFSDDRFRAIDNDSSGTHFLLITNRRFRDASAWYHIVFRIDTTQSTANDRVRVYVNGVQETSLHTNTQPSQNENLKLLTGGQTNREYINRIYGGSAGSGDFYLSHFHFADGQSYGPDTFGSTDSTTGEWRINVSPTVTYGNQGFFIFKDNASLTDQSSNSNDWSSDSGTVQKSEDNPSNNFATLNPRFKCQAQATTFSNGATTGQSPNSQGCGGISTLAASSGKFYAEFKQSAESTTNEGAIGVCDTYYMNNNDNLGGSSNPGYIEYSVACFGLRDGSGGNFYSSNGSKVNNSSGQHGNWVNGDIIMVAMDLDNNRLYFGKNGQWQNTTSWNSATPSTYITLDSTGFEGSYHFVVGDSSSGNNVTWQANFGNGYFGTTAITSEGTNASGIGKFEYDVPTGYTALSTKGLNL